MRNEHRRLGWSARLSGCAAGLLLGLVLAGASALAAWGPTGECTLHGAHCYAIAYRAAHVYGSIAAEDNEVANVSDWANLAFIDNEQWASFPGTGVYGWVEAGITIGNGKDCCTAYPFYASTSPQHVYKEYIGAGPVASGSGQYNYDMIYDSEHNGAFHVYWSAATNTANFFEVARYGGGFPVFITEQQAGLEDAQDNVPYHAGRQEVAIYNGGEWLPWTGALRYHDRGVCIGTNRELGAAGDIEWTPGHNEC